MRAAGSTNSAGERPQHRTGDLRDSVTGPGMGAQHESQFRPHHVDRDVDYEAGGVELLRLDNHVACVADLEQRLGGYLIEQHAETADNEVVHVAGQPD